MAIEFIQGWTVEDCQFEVGSPDVRFVGVAVEEIHATLSILQE